MVLAANEERFVCRALALSLNRPRLIFSTEKNIGEHVLELSCAVFE